MVIFIDFFQVFIDFGRISEGFREDFSMIFRIFFESADLQNLCAHAVFRKGRALQNHQKFKEKSMKNQCKFGIAKKQPHDALKTGLGKVLGSIWEAVGAVWGVFLALLGTFDRFFVF